MDIISIIASIFACYIFFGFANASLLLCYEGKSNSTKQQYINAMMLSNKLYDIYVSINGKDYSNKINLKYAAIVTIIPLFNIIWLIVTLYRFYNILCKP